MNSITDLLDLEDADIFISDISISGVTVHAWTVTIYALRKGKEQKFTVAEYRNKRYN